MTVNLECVPVIWEDYQAGEDMSRIRTIATLLNRTDDLEKRLRKLEQQRRYDRFLLILTSIAAAVFAAIAYSAYI